MQLLGSAEYGYLTILGEFGGAEFPGVELRALISAKALLCYDCQCALKIFQTVCRIGSIELMQWAESRRPSAILEDNRVERYTSKVFCSRFCRCLDNVFAHNG